MECQTMSEHNVYPIFFDVEPTKVRTQSGAVGDAFSKHEREEAAGKWREALREAADLAGWELKNTLDGHEAKLIKKVVQEISLELRSIHSGFDEKLVGMETRVNDVVSSLEIGIDEVRMIGIKGMGGSGKTTTARAVFDHLSNHFEAKSFVENVREVSNSSVSGLKKLQEQILSDLLKEVQFTHLSSVNDGKNMMKRRMCGTKVLLVLDDVNHIDQLEALASAPNWFKTGSRIIITTRDEQMLVAHRVHLIRDISLLSHNEAICLFSRYAFGREHPLQGYEELSRKVVRYAAGLPLIVKVLGSFLCGKDKDEWVDAIERLKKIPLKETMEKLELSYYCLEDEYKEIFLDIACIFKGHTKEDAIRILECCGFHARIGLKVLEHRSLITISSSIFGHVLGMHDHIEEMGKNIVRREHPNEPNKHSRLWKKEEIEDILENDMGAATRCLKLERSRRISPIILKGLEKMKKLQYLDADFEFYKFEMKKLQFLNVLFTLYRKKEMNFSFYKFSLPNSFTYLKCQWYPFLYLPETFQANNLFGLWMRWSKMVQLREKGEKRHVLQKLKFVFLDRVDLTTFDFRITPNLETLTLMDYYKFVELRMPASCQKLKYLHITGSKLITFDLGLAPNLEILILSKCAHLVNLHVSPNLKILNLYNSRVRSLVLDLIPNLERLDLNNCADFVELQVSIACTNLKSLNLSQSKLRSLDLGLISNLEILDLADCRELVEINAPVGCLKKISYLSLSGCFRFTNFKFCDRSEPKVCHSSATLYLIGESLDLCPLHPNSNLPKFQFRCDYDEYLPSSVGNIEKLISFGLCACTDLKKFSDIICSLQRLQKLTLKIWNISDFPKDLGQLECLEELCLYSTNITRLPDSICMLKHLKSLEVHNGDLHEKFLFLKGNLLEKLPEDLGLLECLEKLYVSSKKIEYLPDSICMLKRLKSLDVTECCLVRKLP